MSFVTAEKLDDWGVTLYEAAEIAKQNLDERPFAVMSISDKLFIAETGDAYDGTRLLLIDKIRRLDLIGAPMALPINRDCLLIAGSEDIEGLTMLLKIAELKISEARPLCPIPMVLTENDEWET
jgi:hypothetical protein